MAARRAQCAFTLVEVLVSLFIMAVLAGLAWRGLDVMLRARDAGTRAVSDAARLNTILSQWEQDLGALYDTGVVPPLAFDGQTLLLTRSGADGVSVVAWSLRSGLWQRWSSASVTRMAAVQQAWLGAQQLMGNEPAQVRLLDGVDEWQLYYYRGNAWTNAQSTGDFAAMPVIAAVAAASATTTATAASAASAASAPAAASAPLQVLRELLPSGVRLVVRTRAGSLTRDIALGPQLQ